jgi:hypothetical protein
MLIRFRRKSAGEFRRTRSLYGRMPRESTGKVFAVKCQVPASCVRREDLTRDTSQLTLANGIFVCDAAAGSIT